MLKILDVPELGEEASVDCLGRITIPITIRRKYDIFPGEKAEIMQTKEGILIRNIKTIDDRQKEYNLIECEIENIVKKYAENIVRKDD